MAGVSFPPPFYHPNKYEVIDMAKQIKGITITGQTPDELIDDNKDDK